MLTEIIWYIVWPVLMYITWLLVWKVSKRIDSSGNAK